MEPLSHRGLPRLSWIDTLYSSTCSGRGGGGGGKAGGPGTPTICWVMDGCCTGDAELRAGRGQVMPVEAALPHP